MFDTPACHSLLCYTLQNTFVSSDLSNEVAVLRSLVAYRDDPSANCAPALGLIAFCGLQRTRCPRACVSALRDAPTSTLPRSTCALCSSSWRMIGQTLPLMGRALTWLPSTASVQLSTDSRHFSIANIHLRTPTMLTLRASTASSFRDCVFGGDEPLSVGAVPVAAVTCMLLFSVRWMC